MSTSPQQQVEGLDLDAIEKKYEGVSSHSRRFIDAENILILIAARAKHSSRSSAIRIQDESPSKGSWRPRKRLSGCSSRWRQANLAAKRALPSTDPKYPLDKQLDQ